ncbi:hypothetical protein HELRODRAFT_163643 [Helobdella robusta]|uniref:Tetraspanin n=1 Tax=Helobdella robusta TaxID=6412 RepID=T1EUB0_HELRO|nr:hypothetical protein HELRODRAFT_163643 [Helobdella robusta]ESN96566.1 hypothetical protein HELRODRAFT_163643 [Helobdella robusta]
MRKEKNGKSNNYWKDCREKRSQSTINNLCKVLVSLIELLSITIFQLLQINHVDTGFDIDKQSEARSLIPATVGKYNAKRCLRQLSAFKSVWLYYAYYNCALTLRINTNKTDIANIVVTQMPNNAAANLVGQKFNDSMPKYKNDSLAREYIDSIQNGFTCCGYNGYKDWSNLPQFKSGELPGSCCTNFTGKFDGCNYLSQNESYYYQVACITPIQSNLKAILFGFGIISSITAGALLITLILASCLADKMRKEYNPV